MTAILFMSSVVLPLAMSFGVMHRLIALNHSPDTISYDFTELVNSVEQTTSDPIIDVRSGVSMLSIEGTDPRYLSAVI
jgi:hypothetical protein